jgi:hypothetical protein
VIRPSEKKLLPERKKKEERKIARLFEILHRKFSKKADDKHSTPASESKKQVRAENSASTPNPNMNLLRYPYGRSQSVSIHSFFPKVVPS